jgi:hypothetical protein
MHATMEAAIAREKQLKKWNRQWKIRLIEAANPEWLDLFDRVNVAILDHRRISNARNPSGRTSCPVTWVPAFAGMTLSGGARTPKTPTIIRLGVHQQRSSVTVILLAWHSTASLGRHAR